MKIRVYNKGRVFVPASPESLYAKMNEGGEYKTFNIPRNIFEALAKCSGSTQTEFLERLYLEG